MSVEASYTGPAGPIGDKHNAYRLDICNSKIPGVDDLWSDHKRDGIGQTEAKAASRSPLIVPKGGPRLGRKGSAEKHLGSLGRYGEASPRPSARADSPCPWARVPCAVNEFDDERARAPSVAATPSVQGVAGVSRSWGALKRCVRGTFADGDVWDQCPWVCVQIGSRMRDIRQCLIYDNSRDCAI